MGILKCALLLLPAIVLVPGQKVPTSYPYDCRRTAVGCGNGAMCNPNDGTCACLDDFAGADCKLKSSSVKTCPDNTCENNAICYDSDGSNACYCDSNTYGAQCENPRVNVWCTGSDMFINLYPHGDGNFTGNVFVSTPNNDGRVRPNCVLQKVEDSLDLSSVNVTTVQGNVPSLLGYYILLPHKAVDGVPKCTDAVVTSNNESTNYTQRVVVEYNDKMISGVDQVFSFTCSVVKTAGSLSSDNAMSVKVVGDDYDRVNATDKIEPVSFVIETADGTAVTNTVGLGDPLNLVFSLQVSEADTGPAYTDFKVTECTATNSAPGEEAAEIKFLENDCPAPGSELLYRGNILQKSDTGIKQTIIPLSAFRFVGSVDQVSFTCHLKLCTTNDTAEDPGACKKTNCPTDVLDQDTSSGGDSGTVNNTDTGTTNGTDTAMTNDTADGANGTTDATDITNSTDADSPVTQPPAARRKRAAVDKEKEVTQVINVSSGYNTKEGTEGNASSVQDRDCMQHTQVVTVIIIFSVIVFIMLLVIVGLVLRQLRSRAKVVDANEMSSETLSRYSLPRLSVATTI